MQCVMHNTCALPLGFLAWLCYWMLAGWLDVYILTFVMSAMGRTNNKTFFFLFLLPF